MVRSLNSIFLLKGWSGFMAPIEQNPASLQPCPKTVWPTDMAISRNNRIGLADGIGAVDQSPI
jgi:hypothetical protein